MTEAKEQVRTTVLCFGAAFGVPGPHIATYPGDGELGQGGRRGLDAVAT
jgi:hypothetical protein